MSIVDYRVLKSYDIRGTYPDQLDERFAYLLGRALPKTLPARRVVVGHDSRISSPALYAALWAGLREGGAQACGVGLCPTELIYYLTGHSPSFEAGVMITASHNPPDYNGFKVVRTAGEPVTRASGLGAALRLMESFTDPVPAHFPPPPQAASFLTDYAAFACSLIGLPDAGTLKVVVDAGNGVGGLLWDELAKRLGIEPVRMNFQPDGRFPAHPPDPTRLANLEPLAREVRRLGADIGFCYDGDADRVVAVLSDGHIVDGSETIVCVVHRLMERNPELIFGVGQTTSRKALDYFRQIGWEPVMLPVGHAKIKSLLRASSQMTFAGEDAGHYYYRDFYCCDSALITTLHLLHLASEGKLAHFLQSLPGPWHRPAKEPSFPFDDQAHALAVCRHVALTALEAGPEPQEITCEIAGRVLRRCSVDEVQRCDGVRADYEDWWFCVRPSGTEPIARLALEARSATLLADKTEWLTNLFETMR